MSIPAPTTVRVDVKSSWASKINWTQAIAALSMVLTVVFGPSAALSAEQQLAIVTVIGLLGQVVTWIIRTWFTRSITAASA